MAEISRRTAFAGVIGTTGLGLVGCGADEPLASSPTVVPTTPAPAPTPTAAPVDARPRWPLTGQLLTDPAAAKHAAVAVKVPDNKNEHPQVGINEADIVFVQRDGYPDSKGYDGTRLMPVYHSNMAKESAPVRSIRPVDAPLLAPMTAVIGSSGGAPWVVNYLNSFSKVIKSDLVYLKFRKTGSYSRNNARVYRHNGKTEYDRALVCHPGVLAEKSGVFKDGPTKPYFPWADSVNAPSTDAGKAAAYVGVPWKGKSFVMGYTYDAAKGVYLRSMPWGPHKLANGDRVTTDNVLVIRTKWTRAKIFEGAGGAEPIHGIVNGKGTFVYAHKGKYVTGTWTKGAADGAFSFVLDNGQPLHMAPGRTFVELPAENAEVLYEAP